MNIDISKDKIMEIQNRLRIEGHIKNEAVVIFKKDNCVLVEFYTGKTFTYEVVNVNTFKRKYLFHRKRKITESKFKEIAERISSLKINEKRDIAKKKLLFQREQTIFAEDKEETLIKNIFKNVMPEYGYSVRKNQIDLAVSMYHSLKKSNIALCEAEVGTGKTFAYLLSAIIFKFSREKKIDGICSYKDKKAKIKLNEKSNKPIIISTSSIALQRALIEDYIPAMSKILKEWGILKKPLLAVVRKGKGHYICDQRLEDCIRSIKDKPEYVKFKKLLEVSYKQIDLDDYDDFTRYEKNRINVNDKCSNKCRKYFTCRYNRFLKQAMSSTYDIQICNHNYFLADIKRKSQNKSPLIPDYFLVVVDEAHKIMDTARQMYNVPLSKTYILKIINVIEKLDFKKKKTKKSIQSYIALLLHNTNGLFNELFKNISKNTIFEDTEKFKTNINKKAWVSIKSIIYGIDSLIDIIENNIYLIPKKNNLLYYIIKSLKDIKEKCITYLSRENIIYWLEIANRDKSKITLCSIPKDLHRRLYNDLWIKRAPMILTSGTLSESGSFNHLKRKTGIETARRARIDEVIKGSPFNYKENALMYINANLPYPNPRENNYINGLAMEIKKLIEATYGHTVVLFTSYRVMGLVFEKVSKTITEYPMIKMNKRTLNPLDRFKQSKSGVLFATGSFWEGIDIPGDILSSLIIVKLPFAVPDPISKYEQTLYRNFDEYKDKVVFPEMIIKLKQGVGRLIRSETDTGAISILDSRMKKGGNYYNRVIKALPNCPVTHSISDVRTFIHNKKEEDYFI
jgi:ATP-dependent DNA helicase DinG